MHSLKELRAENAARRLSIGRTADEDDVATPATALPAAAGVAVTAPRAGRTLAPITSTGSLVSSSTSAAVAAAAAAAATPAEPAQEQEDREARRRRRLRRRREREQRDNDNDNDDDNSKVNVDDNATAVSGASRASSTPGEEAKRGGESAAGAAADTAAGEKGGVQYERRGSDSERKGEQIEAESTGHQHIAAAQDKNINNERKSAATDGDGFEKPQLSARGAPPQEKPKKKLTPLEARRARIEQQKREEVERKAGGSSESPRPGGAEQPQGTLEHKSDAKPESGAVDAGGRHPSDREGPIRGRSGANRTGQARARKGNPASDSSGGGSDSDNAQGKNKAMAQTTSTMEEKEKDEGSGAEHNLLIPHDKIKDRRPNYNQDNNSVEEGGNQSESSNEGNKSGIEKAQRVDDGDGISNALRGSADSPLEGATGGDGGRFQGMRNRMKKAGKGLISKKNPTLSIQRGEGAEVEDADRAGEAREKGGEPASETMEGTNSGDNLAGAGSKGKAKGAAAVVGDGGGRDRVAGDRNLPEGPVDGSGSSSNESVLTPMMSEAEKDNEFDIDSDEGDKEPKQKRGRSKDKGLADVPLAGDKEVTLGHVVDRKMREMGYIRKPAVDELKNRRSLRDRVAAEGAPEVHFIGEISGAEGFGSGISCRFRVEGGRHWTCLAGLEEGQTHVMHTDFGDTFAPWNHPIDLHYTTKSIQGWPRLMLQVWQLDTNGRNVLRGYGFRHLPSTPGFSEVSVPCWRPSGTMQEEAVAFFLGVTPRLTAEDAVFNRAWDQRCRLVTLPAGTVWVQMNGLFCNLQDQGVDSIS